MNNLGDIRVRSDRPLGAKAAKRERSRGQILILFVMAIFVFVGMVAIVIDVSWYWVNSLRVQRAADAAALAGVVQLPTNPTAVPNGAFALAVAEAKKNGYDNTLPGITVSTTQDPPVSGRRLIVTVSAPVPTFFMRIFGMDSIIASRTSKAEFVLPVPMGSPDNWYGVFGATRGLTSTSTTIVDITTTGTGNSGFKVPTQSFSPIPVTPAWTVTPSGSLVAAVATNDSTFAQTSTNLNNQLWGNFNLLSGLAANETATTVRGIQVRLTDVHVSATCATTTIRVALSYDAGLHWTSNVAGTPPAGNITPALGTSVTTGDYTFGTATTLTSWPLAGPAHTWVGNDLGNTNFRIRLTANKGCATVGTQIRADMIEVRADYNIDIVTPTPVTSTTPVTDVNLKGPGAACTTGKANCYESTGQTLSPNGFWGTMNTEGAENLNGDAYSAYYNTQGGATNPDYNATDFYNYAIEMPPGSSGGKVYVYDPVFCATDHAKGTGDRWWGSSPNQVSSFYEVYDTQGTLQDNADDGAPIADSAGLFGGIVAEDLSMGGTHPGTVITPADCRYATDTVYGDGRDYHDRWYLLASGLSGGTNGKVYRVHTTTTDRNNVGASRTTYGENSFALYTSATVGTPRIYGIGAMQAFTPLSNNGGPAVQSEFYLAQIDAVHAGKTVEIKLWDPGDTNPLSGTLSILVPDAGGWSPTLFDYTAAKGTTNTGAANCNALAGNDVTSVQTSTPTSRFNGCWLTIQIPIPSGYTAQQSGWWKIRYTMTGNGTSDDVTTWKVAIRGNPVHLIVP